MTAIHQQTARLPAGRRSTSVDGLSLGWEVLADAPGVKALLGENAGPSRIRLLLVIGGHRVRAFLDAPACSNQAPRTPIGHDAPISITPANADGLQLMHFDAPGVLRATIAVQAGGPPRVLYARTPLLAAPDFPGGTYDRPEAAWERG